MPWMHLQPSTRQASPCDFYVKLEKILETGGGVTILIVRSGLDNETALLSEDALIKLVGTRAAGTGPLYNVQYNHPISCWGEYFPTVKALAKDKRCHVSYPTLYKRAQLNWPLEEAVLPAVSSRWKSITCWGEHFPSFEHLCRDSRCIVSGPTLRRRLGGGMSPENAATTAPSPGCRLSKQLPHF